MHPYSMSNRRDGVVHLLQSVIDLFQPLPNGDSQARALRFQIGDVGDGQKLGKMKLNVVVQSYLIALRGRRICLRHFVLEYPDEEARKFKLEDLTTKKILSAWKSR